MILISSEQKPGLFVFRSMQKVVNVLYLLRQSVMLIGWHMLCKGTLNVKHCMVISHRTNVREPWLLFGMDGSAL